MKNPTTLQPPKFFDTGSTPEYRGSSEGEIVADREKALLRIITGQEENPDGYPDNGDLLPYNEWSPEQITQRIDSLLDPDNPVGLNHERSVAGRKHNSGALKLRAPWETIARTVDIQRTAFRDGGDITRRGSVVMYGPDDPDPKEPQYAVGSPLKELRGRYIDEIDFGLLDRIGDRLGKEHPFNDPGKGKETIVGYSPEDLMIIADEIARSVFELTPGDVMD